MDTPAYAVAYLRDVDFGDEIVEYIRRIEATLAPYDGRFIVHGGHLTPLEGDWDGDLVVIEFPRRQAAIDWYESRAYQAILRLRTGNSQSITAIVDGVPPGYRATQKIVEVLGSE
jgi:uncharacterized protein (DUF1330 family)